MLLSDKDTASFIKDNFVATWKEVRPVPKVTIDFGNGKVMKRTLTGNTVMYVSLPDGTVVDAFPGVYSPTGFRKVAAPALAAAVEAAKRPADKRGEFLASWHKGQVRDLAAKEKAATSMAKTMVESPLLDALAMYAVEPKSAPDAARPSPFEHYAGRLRDLSKKPARSEAVVRDLGLRDVADRKALADKIIEADSATNVGKVHPAVHMLLIERGLATADSLCDTVYKKLLHIDIDDPYLGLRDVPMPGTPDR